jgi:UDP-N-acetylmuramoyl-tripeptide--D-alanyl-D-alanine ligase
MVYQPGRGIRIIDDTFNANPNSMKAAIDVLSHMGKGQKIAVLGSMLELGRYSNEGHVSVGRYLASKKINHLYTFGDQAGKIGKAAIASGFKSKRVKHFTKRSRLNREIIRLVRPGAAILIKGSNSVNMRQTARYLHRSIGLRHR